MWMMSVDIGQKKICKSTEYNPKLYGDELYSISPKENSIRLMLYLNKLPLNQFMRDKLNHNIEGYCDYETCYENGIEETTHHFLCYCPQNESERIKWIEKMNKYINLSNEKIRGASDMEKLPKEFHGKKELKIIYDKENENYPAQYTIPPACIMQTERIKMLRETINFIKKSDRFYFH